TEKGVVTSIHVHEGQFVRQGDPLVELDRTLTQADQYRISHEWHLARLTLTRQRALQQRMETPSIQGAMTFPADATLQEQHLQQELLASEWLGFQSRLASLESQLATRNGERDANRALIARL